MAKLFVPTGNRKLTALALAAVPAATAAMVALDQSMHRPSLVRVVLQTLHFAF